MSSGHRTPSEAPTRVDQIRSGDPYELSNGRAIYCAPTGHEGAGPNGLGFAVLDSDPAVKRAGVDTGIALGPRTLRAPNVAVNFEAGDGTWVTRIANVDESLTAPGVLALPVPVRALFDRDAAHEATLRNLLSAKGYASLDAVRAEGRDAERGAALQAALRATAQARGLTLDAAQDARVAACHDADVLLAWVARAATATTAAAIFEGPDGR